MLPSNRSILVFPAEKDVIILLREMFFVGVRCKFSRQFYCTYNRPSLSHGLVQNCAGTPCVTLELHPPLFITNGILHFHKETRIEITLATTSARYFKQYSIELPTARDAFSSCCCGFFLLYFIIQVYQYQKPMAYYILQLCHAFSF